MYFLSHKRRKKYRVCWNSERTCTPLTSSNFSKIHDSMGVFMYEVRLYAAPRRFPNSSIYVRFFGRKKRGAEYTPTSSHTSLFFLFCEGKSAFSRRYRRFAICRRFFLRCTFNAYTSCYGRVFRLRKLREKCCLL